MELGQFTFPEICFELPVFPGNKDTYLLLPLTDQTQRHGLYPPSGETFLDHAPEQGAHRVAHQPVQHSPGLLSIHLGDVYIAGFFYGFHDCLGGNLVKDYPLHLLAFELLGKSLRDVPGNGFSFAVVIRGQEDGINLADGFFELREHLGFAFVQDVFGLEVFVHVYSEAALGQVPDVSVRSLHHVLVVQELTDGIGFGG